MTNSSLIGNTAVVFGGGSIFNRSTAKIVGSRLIGNSSGNQGGSIDNNTGGNLIVVDSLLYDNRSIVGGGIINYSILKIENSTVVSNTSYSGGGIHNPGTLSVINGRLLHNSADYGGAIYSGGDVLVHDSIIVGNSARYRGGGIRSFGVLTMTNNSVTDNSADEGGGFWTGCSYQHCGSSIVTNSILWANNAITSPQVFRGEEATILISYSDVQGAVSGGGWDISLGTDGGGNIDSDPLFRRIPDSGDGDWSTLPYNDYGDLRLQLTSPAIDAGDNDAVPAGLTTDLDGRPRFVDIVEVPDTGSGTPPMVDMGAYEADYYGIYLPVIVR